MENSVNANSVSSANFASNIGQPDDIEDEYGEDEFEEDEEMIDYQFFGSPDSGGGDGHPPIHILPNASEFPSVYNTRDDTHDTSNNRSHNGGSDGSAVGDSRHFRVRPEIFHNSSPFPPHLGNLLGPIRATATRRKRSIVHQHFKLNVQENRYYCKYCPRNYAKTRDSSTGQLQLHLKQKHGQLIFGSLQREDSNSDNHSNSLINTFNTHSQSSNNSHRPVPVEQQEVARTNFEHVEIKPEFEADSPEEELLEKVNSDFQIPKIVSSASLQNQSSRGVPNCVNTNKQNNHPKTLNRERLSMFTMAESATNSQSGNLPPCASDSSARLSGVLGVIGGGNMARAIIVPLFDLKVVDPSKVIVSGTNLGRLEFWGKLGCATTTDNCKVIEESDTILWAVKPQMFPKVLDKIRDQVGAEIPARFYHKLHLSVLAGISLLQFHKMLTNSLFWARVGKHEDGFNQLPEFSRTLISAESTVQAAVRVARIMPNMGLRVKAGCAAYCLGERTTCDDDRVIKALFSHTGVCLNIDETQAHAYGAMIGCGIGFMFPLMEAFSDGAVRVGIPREAGLKLAAQAMKGAAELYLREGLHPGVLKDSVCSPGGTTIAGIAELEKNGIRSALISAVEASTKRSEELGKLASQAQASK